MTHSEHGALIQSSIPTGEVFLVWCCWQGQICEWMCGRDLREHMRCVLSKRMLLVVFCLFLYMVATFKNTHFFIVPHQSVIRLFVSAGMWKGGVCRWWSCPRVGIFWLLDGCVCVNAALCVFNCLRNLQLRVTPLTSLWSVPLPSWWGQMPEVISLVIIPPAGRWPTIMWTQENTVKSFRVLCSFNRMFGWRWALYVIHAVSID